MPKGSRMLYTIGQIVNGLEIISEFYRVSGAKSRKYFEVRCVCGGIL